MLFNSFQFLVFFIVVTITYFIIPFKHRAWFLLAASCCFYMFFVPIYILILALTIGIDYFAGIYIENAQRQRRKVFLITSIVVNVGVLCVFKYYNFFIENANVVLQHMGINTLPYLKILLPIGLSFHTFQAMSYTIEVYRGKQAAEHNFIIYALYVMFYPQLVAGPIERPQNMLHQFKEKHDFNYPAVVTGLRLILWGVFKKMVIADRLATYVNEVYNHLPHYEGVPLILATLFFTIQIYCDFSGYSDIAIGTARIMGFTLMKNFNIPYYSQSISEFWRRWHISLSTWFRDYLYFPMGGNRVKESRLYFNLFVVFTISGFWHGAGWTYIIWGALHAFYLIIGRLNNNLRLKFNLLTGLDKCPTLLKIVAVSITFALASFAWIFFRANSLHDALYVVTHLLKYNGQLGIGSMTKLKFYFAIASILVMEIVHFFQNKGDIATMLSKQPLILRWSVYSFFILSIIFFGNFGLEKFIYFQF